MKYQIKKLLSASLYSGDEKIGEISFRWCEDCLYYHLCNKLNITPENKTGCENYFLRKDYNTKLVKEFMTQHSEMMKMFLDDDNEFVMKWCEYEVNTNSLIKELETKLNENN